jgi:hypothetical protein
MNIKVEIPVSAIEPLFTALQNVKPTQLSRVESKALGLLKMALYYELEVMMETPEEEDLRKIDFQKIFEEERKKQAERVKEFQEGTY